MVAYSFKKRFADPIAEGRKFQTIRADRKRHARPGEELQLYTGMRTKHCRLLLRTRCTGVYPIAMCPGRNWAWIGEGFWGHSFGDEAYDASEIGLDKFGMSGRFVAPYMPALARADGFSDWGEMRDFWFAQHDKAREEEYVFLGVLVYWGVRT